MDLHSTPVRIHHTDKLSQQGVPRAMHHPASMLEDDQAHGLPVDPQGADGRLFIFPDEATVALDIGMKDGGKLPFEVFSGHGIPPS